MRYRSIMRWDGRRNIYRIGRVIWQTGVHGHGGYSAKLTISLKPTIYELLFRQYGWDLTILGVRLSVLRSYGGYFT